MAERIDPAGARTPDEFIVLLRRAAARAHHPEADRLAALLDHYDMPPEALVIDLLRASGMDMAQEDRWMRVYDELSQWDSMPPLAPEELDDRELLRARHRRRGWITRGRVLIASGVVVFALVAWLLLANRSDDPAALIGGQSPTPGATDVASPSAEASPEATSSPAPRQSAPPNLSGTVTLGNGQSFDLDGGGHDVKWQGSSLHSADNGKRLQLMPAGTTPSKQACSALIPGQLERSVDGLSAGRSLCVRTTENRWARITVTSVGSSLGFTYVVFS